MQRNTRWLRLDICDYAGTPLCNLYDSSSEVSGQANDIVVHTERNGYKEIRFVIPSTCSGEEGEERNYRLDYLISDYKIRIQSKKAYDAVLGADSPVETDWFFVSESKVQHNNLSGNYEIQAKHVSQLLNTMNMDLEFSDEEGNNTGTIGEIALEILGGTGWHLGTVAEFQEEDKYLRDGELVEKKRSFNAEAKTGAFKMMSDLCEMFDAKPIYHGEGAYQGFNVEGTNLSNVQHSLYGEGYDLYEATKAKDKAETAGWTDVVIVEGDVLYGRTVDILPINPFSKDIEEGGLPDTVASHETDVIELYYDKNVKNLTRTLNTDNLVTKLTSYGSFGDRNGACSLQKAEHALYTLSDVREDNPTGKLIADQEYRFLFPPSVENGAYFYFTPTEDIPADTMKWSSLDFASRSYVYDGEHLYKTYKQSQEQQYITLEPTVVYEKNYFPFVMDFSYFQKIGLFNDGMYENLAEFQTSMPAKYKEAEEKAVDLGMIKSELSETASAGEGYLKLSVASKTTVDGNVVLTLDTSDPKHRDGVLYRSDYDEAKRNRFSWRTASGIKSNGTAVAGKGSVVYIINPGNPTTWVKAYVKAVGNGTKFYYRDEYDEVYECNQYVHYTKKERVTGDDPNTISQFPSSPASGNENKIHVADDTQKTYIWKDNDYVEVYASDFDYGLNDFKEPTTIMLWTSSCTLNSGTQVFMFSADSIAGVFGPREDAIISNKQAIEETIKVTTQTYPVYFIDEYDSYPSTDLAQLGYGWLYRSLTGTEYLWGALWFCWGTKPSELGTEDIDWGPVYVSRDNTNPEAISILTGGMQNYRYYYSTIKKKLYVRDNETNRWKPIGDSTDEKHVSSSFASVVKAAIKHEVLSKGVREEYYHSFGPLETLPVGNYAFENEYGNYWLFTVDRTIDPSAGGQLRLKTKDKTVWQDNDMEHIITPSEYSFDYVSRADANELSKVTFSKSGYRDHAFSSKGTKYISGNISVYENVEYEFVLPANSKVVCLSKSSKFLEEFTTSPCTMPKNAYKVRIVCPDESHGPSSIEGATFHVKGYGSCIFVKEKQYKVISCTATGDRLGMTYLMNEFLRLSSEAYDVALPALQAIQEEITASTHDFNASVGDMYREGYWQENDYSEGDEDKLYLDSLDNIKEIAQPEATYEFTYLDLYKSQRNLGLSGIEDSEDVEYPDVDISCAAHLVDPEIDTNCWAYIDSVDKCYDQPWKTTMEINTRLSMIGQQSFTDVLSRIAEVANSVKANQGIYKKAKALTGSGKLAADRLEGAIQANRVFILGGTSNWWTDDKGNIVFEAADGSSAMMLSGRGWAISSTKDAYGDWNWRYMATGLGLTADAIYTGYLSASVIEAGSITADKLSASVGEELELSSNKSLTLYATVDGERPAGSLLTEHPGEGDSWIEIAAKDDNQEAHIAIKSGGEINIEGGSLNVTSNGTIDVDGNSDITIHSGGALKLSSIDQIKIGNDDFGTSWNSITNTITQNVMSQIHRVFIQLEQPEIGQEDPTDPEAVIETFFRGDRWIAVDPVTLQPAAVQQQQPTGGSGSSYYTDILENILSSLETEEGESYSNVLTEYEISNKKYIFMEDVEILETSQESENDPVVITGTVSNAEGAILYAGPTVAAEIAGFLEYGTEVTVTLQADELWGILPYEEEEEELESGVPVYMWTGTEWMKLSAEEDIVNLQTQLKQNEQSIELTARKTTKIAGDLVAVLSVAADKIVSTVSSLHTAEGSISTLQQTADNIILGVTAVGKLITDGSYISIYENMLDMASSGQIRLSSNTGLILRDFETGIDDPFNSITMNRDGMDIATKGRLRLASGASLGKVDTQTDTDDPYNAIIMDNNGMNFKTQGKFELFSGGGIYLTTTSQNEETEEIHTDNCIEMTPDGMNITTTGNFLVSAGGTIALLNTNTQTGDDQNRITMTDNGMDIYTQGHLHIAASNIVFDTAPITNSGTTLASSLAFLDGKIESTVASERQVVYKQQEDPAQDPEIRPNLKVGDYWILTSEEQTWEQIDDVTWEEVRNNRWGNYLAQCPVYAWDGEDWMMISDPSYLNIAFSRITQTETMINLEVARVNDIEGDIRTVIQQTADSILLSASSSYYGRVSYMEISSSGIQITGSKYINLDIANGAYVHIDPNKIKLRSINDNDQESIITITGAKILMDTQGKIQLAGDKSSSIYFYDTNVYEDTLTPNTTEGVNFRVNKNGLYTHTIKAGKITADNITASSIKATDSFYAPFMDSLVNIVVSRTKPAAGNETVWVKPTTTTTSQSFTKTYAVPAIAAHACSNSSGQTMTISGTSISCWRFRYEVNLKSSFKTSEISSATFSGSFKRWGQDFYKSFKIVMKLLCEDGTVLDFCTPVEYKGWDEFRSNASAGSSGAGQIGWYRGTMQIPYGTNDNGRTFTNGKRIVTGVRYDLYCPDSYAHYCEFYAGTITVNGTKTVSTDTTLAEVHYIP